MKIKSTIFAILVLGSSFAIGASEIELSREDIESMYNFSLSSEEKHQKFDNFVEANITQTYSLSKLSISYGMLSAPVGGGRVNVETSGNGKISEISVTADIGIPNIYTASITESIDIDSLKSGEILEFSMEGSRDAVMKIIPKKGFGDFGGSADIKINTNDGWKTESVQIWPAQNSGRYYIWKGNVIKSSISVNMRGTSVKNFKVGSYEIK